MSVSPPCLDRLQLESMAPSMPRAYKFSETVTLTDYNVRMSHTCNRKGHRETLPSLSVHHIIVRISYRRSTCPVPKYSDDACRVPGVSPFTSAIPVRDCIFCAFSMTDCAEVSIRSDARLGTPAIRSGAPLRTQTLSLPCLTMGHM